MYNLIVTARKDAWDGSPYRLEVDRFGEYANATIIPKYKTLDQSAIAELQSLPTLFAYEHQHNADAKVGLIQRLTTRSGHVQIDYAFYPGLPPIPASQLAAL